MSVFTTATTAVVDALAGTAPIVNRVRYRAIAADVQRAIVVRPGRRDVVELPLATGMPVAWRMLAEIECYQRMSAGQSPDEAIDPLVTDVYERLMADPTLGGAAYGIEPGSIEPEYETEVESVVKATLTLSILLRSQGATL